MYRVVIIGCQNLAQVQVLYLSLERPDEGLVSVLLQTLQSDGLNLHTSSHIWRFAVKSIPKVVSQAAKACSRAPVRFPDNMR
jgi:hypothetical protein